MKLLRTSNVEEDILDINPSLITHMVRGSGSKYTQIHLVGGAVIYTDDGDDEYLSLRHEWLEALKG